MGSGGAAVPNVKAHPSTVSVPIIVLLYNNPLLCTFNVPIKGLTINGKTRTFQWGPVPGGRKQGVNGRSW